MSDVTVVIPYRGDSGGHRDRALDWVLRWWAARHPGWPVVTGGCEGQWCKAVAVADGLARTDSPVVVVADGDMFTDGVDAAVDAVRSGGHAWAVPHTLLHRLTVDATATVLAGDPARPVRWRHLPTAETPYTGVAGGSMTVVSRPVLGDVPMPPIPGWGQQDMAWALALQTLAGPCWRGPAPICHLWHDPPRRMSRRWGSLESRAWYGRYADARGNRERMRAVVDEDRARLTERMGVARWPSGTRTPCGGRWDVSPRRR